VLRALADATLGGGPEDERHAEIRRIVQAVLVERLTGLARRQELRANLRAPVENSLERIRDALEASSDDTHAAFLVGQITRFLERPAPASAGPWAPADPPPGSPIGTSRSLGACGH
jgi:hypothetical protein